MPRVFVVNEPLKRDGASGEFARKYDLAPAREFGELVHMSVSGDPAEGWEEDMRRVAAGYSDGDYLLPIGRPDMIAAAAAYVAVNARFSGFPIRVLRWTYGRYVIKEIRP